MRLTAAIVDDEQPARQRIQDLLAQDPNIQLVGSFQDGHEAVLNLLNSPPLILFLDIQMPGLNGFEVLQKIGAQTVPAIIFATAYDQYAVSAFEQCALDYLLKPYEDERFFQALERAKKQALIKGLASESAPLTQLINLIGMKNHVGYQNYVTRIPIKTKKEVLLLDVDQILYASAQGPYLDLHTHEKTYLVRMKMGTLEEQLNPEKFFRIHRSTLVNLHFVRALIPLFKEDYAVEMQNGVRLRLSRSRRDALRHHLGMSF